MPIIPPATTAPFDTVDDILNFARVIANDCAISLSGNLLSDAQPYTYTLLKLAWRKLQDRLSSNSIEAFPEEVILPNIIPQPASALLDPAIYCYVDYGAYFDGINSNLAPTLPQDLEIPLRVWERPTGQNASFSVMVPSSDGLPSRPKSARFGVWQWQGNALWLPGSSQATDLRVRYKRFLVDTPDTGTAPVPLLRCAVSLAYLVVECFAEGRGSAVSGLFTKQKEQAIKDLINTTTRKKQRGNYRRIPYSRRGSNRF